MLYDEPPFIKILEIITYSNLELMEGFHCHGKVNFHSVNIYGKVYFEVGKNAARI